MPGHTKKAKGGVKYKAKGSMRYKAKKGTKLGMQSVKYGLDNNPEVTAADPKAKFIAKDKKKAKKGMKAENGLKPIVKTKKNPITGRTKTKAIIRNADGSTTKSKVKRNRFGEVVKQKTKTTGTGTTKTKKKYTKSSGTTVTSEKPRKTVKSIARGVAAIPVAFGTMGAAVPGLSAAVASGVGAKVLKDTKVGKTLGKVRDKAVEGVNTAAEKNMKNFDGSETVFGVDGSKYADKKTEKGNTFMMGGRVNYPGKVSPDSNYDMLNKQQS